MHGQLLFQVFDLALHFLNQELLVHLLVHNRHVFNLSHSGRKSQSRNGLFNMGCFRPDVGAQYSLAVASNRVLKDVGQSALPIRHMVTLLVAGTDHYLLEERQTLVDVGGFLHLSSNRACFLDAFIASQVHQVQLGVDDFLLQVNIRAAFYMDRENSMTPG